MAEERPLTDASPSEIIRAHFDMVYRLALSQTRSVPNAEDVVQEVFLRFIQKHSGFKSDEHIRAWLIRVTINCSKSILMSAWNRKTVPLTEEIVFDTPEKSEVYFAVQNLPSKYRAVIHLFYYEDMNVKEISDAVGLKQSTVKSRLFRAREMLRQTLKGGYDFV